VGGRNAVEGIQGQRIFYFPPNGGCLIKNSLNKPFRDRSGLKKRAIQEVIPIEKTLQLRLAKHGRSDS